MYLRQGFGIGKKNVLVHQLTYPPQYMYAYVDGKKAVRVGVYFVALRLITSFTSSLIRPI